MALSLFNKKKKKDRRGGQMQNTLEEGLCGACASTRASRPLGKVTELVSWEGVTPPQELP